MAENEVAIIEPKPFAEFTDAQKELIKRTVAKGATDDELALFLHCCRKANLDPLRRQAHFVKYGQGDKATVNIIVGIDGFQKRLTADPRYLGMNAAAVRENDVFELNPVTGQIKHVITNPDPAKRGKLLGAYAILYRKGMIPITSWVSADECKLSGAIGGSMPEGMVTKDARALLIRREYPEELSSLYTDSEFGLEITESGELQEAVSLPATTEPEIQSPVDNRGEAEKFAETTIDKSKQKRIWALAGKQNVSKETVREIFQKFGYEHTEAIREKDFDALLAEIKIRGLDPAAESPKESEKAPDYVERAINEMAREPGVEG